MGLSGRKEKQRIPEDPRNVRWANDTSAPGFRLLSSMGWTPDAPGLGLAASQDLIKEGGSVAYNKKISIIPTAKDDNLGIGARRGGGIGGMRAMGVPIGSMGFVTASGSAEPVEAPKKGGEFGRLLERLNKAKEEAKAAAQEAGAPVVEVEVALEEGKEETKEERKARRAAKKEKKRKRGEDDDEESDSPAVATVTTVMEVDSAPTSGASTPTILKNPRMAARSKHLRAKRQAAGNAAAMAEILGIAPPSSTATSASASPAPERVSNIPSTGFQPSAFGAGIGSGGAGGGIGSGVRSEPPAISPPSTEGWPTAPLRSFPAFASASTSIGGLPATFEAEKKVDEPSKPTGMAAYANMFAKASTSASAIPSTFDSAPTIETAPAAAAEAETDRQREKREKRERKEAKRGKRDGSSKGAESPSAPLPGFASASTASLASTIAPSPAAEVESTPASETKAEKKARKEAKALKKALKKQGKGE